MVRVCVVIAAAISVLDIVAAIAAWRYMTKMYRLWLADRHIKTSCGRGVARGGRVAHPGAADG